jgi:hypothetical protein
MNPPRALMPTPNCCPGWWPRGEDEFLEMCPFGPKTTKPQIILLQSSNFQLQTVQGSSLDINNMASVLEVQYDRVPFEDGLLHRGKAAPLPTPPSATSADKDSSLVCGFLSWPIRRRMDRLVCRQQQDRCCRVPCVRMWLKSLHGANSLVEC